MSQSHIPNMPTTGQIKGAAEQAQDTAHEAREKATDVATSRWASYLARFGYAAKGVVYLLMGGIAARFALGAGGEPTDNNGAIRALYAEPFGKLLLAIIAVGLFGYALWNVVRAVLDIDHEGTKPQAILKRIGFVAVAFGYFGLSLAAAQLASGRGSGGKSSDATTQDWTARFLDLRIGVPLVVLGGVLFCAIALAVAYEGYSGRFMKYFSYGKLSQATERALRWLGGFGLLSLAVVFVEIGVFLVVAALQHDPGKAKGLGGALVALAAEPFGPLLLGVVAFGLLAYGVYSFGQARYRRIGPA